VDHDNEAVEHDRRVRADGPGEVGRFGPEKTVLAVNGVITAVGGTYASTHSLAATIAAGCAGLACAAIFACKWKK
jgi:hypothetical protein